MADILANLLIMLDYVWNTLMDKLYLPGISFKLIYLFVWVACILLASIRLLLGEDIDLGD